MPVRATANSSIPSIGVDLSNNVYVVDAGNNRVEKFDNNGNYLTQWGTVGSGVGQLNSPAGLTVDTNGAVYVVDRGNNRLEKFDAAGRFVLSLGTGDSGSGQFNSPSQVALDASGLTILVSDSGNGRLQIFTRVPNPGLTLQPVNQSVTPGGAATFTASAGGAGPLAYQWLFNGASLLNATNNSYSIPSVALANGGNYQVVVSNAYGTVTSTVATLTVELVPYFQQFITGGGGSFNNPYGLAVDRGGNFYVTDSSNHRVVKFDLAGNFLFQWGGQGSGNGQLYFPTGIGVDANTNILVVDDNHRVQKFNSSGGFLAKWGSAGGGNGQFGDYSLGLAVDTAGNVFVADTSNNRVQKFDNNGNYLLQWGSFGSGNGQFKSPEGVGVDLNGNVYVTDGGNRIQKFSNTGVYLAQFGNLGSGPGQVYNPVGVAVAPSGEIYVSDNGNYRIEEFDAAGNFILSWGSAGTGYGQFNTPQNIALDPTGRRLFVAESYNNRVQIFTNTPAPGVIVPPTASTVFVGADTSFTVIAGGVGVGYQWQFNGANLPGATAPTLTLTNLAVTNAGNYAVVLSNAYGVMTSAVASLTVNIPSPGTKLWQASVGGLEGGIALGQQNGQLYVTGVSNNLYALDRRTGATNWVFVSGITAWGTTPTVGPDGGIYVSSGPTVNKIYKVSGQNGSKVWEFQAGGAFGATPALAQDGLLYVGNFDGNFYCLNATNGSLVWSYHTAANLNSSAAIGLNGLVYFGGNDTAFYALNRTNGALAWKFTPGTPYINQSPALGGDGTVYICCNDGRLYALNGSTGAALWSYNAGALIPTSPALGADGTVYIGTTGGALVALDGRTGAARLVASLSGTVQGGPFAGTDGNVYVNTDNALIYAVNSANGLVSWSKAVGGAVGSSVIAPDGKLYVSSTDGNVYCLASASVGGAATSPWPMLNHDAQRRGNFVLPPAVLTSPTNQTLVAGANTSLSAVASGSAPLTYQWLFNGSPLAGATSTNLVLNGITYAQQGAYCFVVANSAGAVTSAVATLTVLDVTPPVITCPGNLTAVATNPGGVVVNFSVPATDDHLPPTVVSTPPSGSLFPPGLTTVNCVATDASGNSNTCSFTVNVLYQQTITQSVQSSVPDNSLLGLASTIVVDTPILSITNVRVFLNLSNGWNGDLYAYLVHNNQLAVLLNRPGKQATNALGYGDAGFAMVFDDQGTNGDVHLYRQQLFGDNSTPLGGSLTGSWQPDARAVNASLVLDTDPRTAWLSAFNGFDARGDWTLYVADLNAGQVSFLNNWSLEIRGTVQPPVFTLQPTNLVAPSYTTAVFTAQANGSLPLAYQWYFNGTTPLPGATNPTLTLTNVTQAQSGNYQVVVTNQVGSATSAVAVLTVIPPPNAPPVIAFASNNVVVLEDAGSVSVSSFLTVISMGATNETNQAILSHTLTADAPALFSVPPAISLAGVLTFTPAPNANGVTTVTVVSQDNGGTAYGGVDKATNTFTISITPVNDPPSFFVNRGCFTTNVLSSLIGWGAEILPGGMNNSFRQVAGGNLHSLAVKSDGAVVAWGGNAYGQSLVPSALTNVAMVAAGYSHSLALRNDGTVVAWGQYFNGSGYVPVTVPSGLSNVVAVAASQDYSLALRNNGRVVAWGDNTYGQTNVPGGLSNVVAVAARNQYSLALKNNGTVVAWGGTDSGVTNVPAGLSNVIAVAAGNGHCLALKNDGTVVAWGASYYGETNIPAGLSNVMAVAAGNSFSIALQSNGTVVVWGDNAYGQTYVPTGLTNVMAVSVGGGQILALKSDGTVAAWGWNVVGQSLVPGQLTGISAMAAGQELCLALKNDGSIVAWGDNNLGQMSVPPAAQSGVIAVAADWYYRMVLKSNGSVVAWGDNSQGQTNVPVAAQSGVVAIAAGAYHSLALKNNGSVLAWGNNNYSQTNVPVSAQSGVGAIAAGLFHSLALKTNNGSVVEWGNTNNANIPVSAQSGVVAIAAGDVHSLALKRDGSVVAWGDNAYGGSSGMTNVPAAALSGVAAIAASGYYSLALKSNGMVVAWGDNASGQTNVPLGAQAAVAGIAAGGNFGLALVTNAVLGLTIAEDSGPQTVPNAVTNISPGPPDEATQTVTFIVTNDTPSLFSAQPAIDTSGTLTYTPTNTFGVATVTVYAKDNGGTANGGVDTSAPQTFTITITPVNDPPMIALATNNLVVLEDAGSVSVPSFATVTSYGANEASQTLLGYTLTADATTLFSVQPALALNGTLTFTTAPNANGVATVTVVSQ
ncbi:MAG: PQQ-binding-like beta-propeller repeat protein, partial [Verrucomicrobiota bacterium]